MVNKVPNYSIRAQPLNTPAIHSLISMDDSAFKQLCSCLDLIGDTELALDAYIAMAYPKAIGEKYIVLYGVLASMRGSG